jgi:hypothetical protein
MLQQYVLNVLAVSVLCCSKCFHVASCKCFIWMLHMFHIHVASVRFGCFIYFTHMLHSTISCYTCFMLFRESGGTGCEGGTTRVPGNEARRARGSGRVRGALVSRGRVRSGPTVRARRGWGCMCGAVRMASNQGRHGWLHLRGELPKRAGAATGAGCACGVGKHEQRGQAARATGRACLSGRLHANTAV